MFGSKVECVVCCDAFTLFDGMFACKNHFYCEECTIEVVQRSLHDINEFPARCCALTRDGIDPSSFDIYLDEQTMDSYLLKLEEFQTPKAERVYCANQECATFLPDERCIYTPDSMLIGMCMCRTSTCFGCRTEWHEDHVCPRKVDPPVKPDWVPEYGPDSRIKQCPGCHEWIELSEACNHMTCILCKHEFCFICLLPWVKEHVGDGCPVYSDPAEGYDEQGYERSAARRYLYTGRDILGYDRRGIDESRRYHDGTMASPESEDTAYNTVAARINDFDRHVQWLSDNVRLINEEFDRLGLL